jgi:hypothetical protein
VRRPLKSFRIKKQSSSLGINQTSESPTPLRRDITCYNREDEDKYATYNQHFRTSSDGTFQRNAGYRSSLQNMNSTSNDFIRNNRYRSTIQNGSMQQTLPLRNSNGRYVYAGSITPTPKSRYLTEGAHRMTPG